MSKQTAATSTIEITSSTPTLMLALELGVYRTRFLGHKFELCRLA